MAVLHALEPVDFALLSVATTGSQRLTTFSLSLVSRIKILILSQSLILWTGPLPALFTLYTSDCRCVASDTVQVKFSECTALTRRDHKE